MTSQLIYLVFFIRFEFELNTSFIFGLFWVFVESDICIFFFFFFFFFCSVQDNTLFFVKKTRLFIYLKTKKDRQLYFAVVQSSLLLEKGCKTETFIRIITVNIFLYKIFYKIVLIEWVFVYVNGGNGTWFTVLAKTGGFVSSCTFLPT